MKLSRAAFAFASLPGLILSLLSAGCGQRAPAEHPVAAKELSTFHTAQPHRQTLKRTIEQPARVEAYEETPIFVKIPGYAKTIFIERQGQEVNEGSPLAELDVPELYQEQKYKIGLVAQAKIDITLAERAFEVAQANTKTSESLVEEAKFGLKRAEAVKARWQSESVRMENLFKDKLKLVNEQDLDETLSQFRSAAAARDEADARQRSAEALLFESQARCNKAKTEIAAAQNRLKLAESDEARVAALLSYAHITAPFKGVVSVRNVHTGWFVQPSDAKPLFVVVRMDKVRVFVDVPERDAGFIKYDKSKKQDVALGSPARIRVPDLGNKEFVGKVAGSSGRLDPDQRTLSAEIDFDNPDGELRPGLYAQAVIDVLEPDAWMIPISAILTRDGQTYGFLLEEGKAVKTLVKIGARDGGFIQILKKQIPRAKPGLRPEWVDLTGNEAFIVDNVSNLSDDQQ